MNDRLNLISGDEPLAIEVVHRMAGSEHEVVVHDMHQPEFASRALQHGVRSLPAVMTEWQTGCLPARARGVEEDVLREALR